MPPKIRRLLFLISSIFLQFFLAPSSVFAIWTLISKIIEYIVLFILLLGISFALLLFSNGILAWVVNPEFIQIGYTNANNPLVQYGWATVRDFVNLFFILIGVIIGIATALRIQQYEIKKILPRLIFIILLINFTPIFCGVMIDAANILMNFFFTAGSGGFNKVVNITGSGGKILVNAFMSSLFNPIQFINGVFFFQVAFVIFFNFTASFVLILFSMLLITRHVALWILVILSPLAFFCYILPTTQNIWRKWWHEFIQWNFIGIGAAFFLYLAQVVISHTGTLFSRSSPASSDFQHGNFMQQLMVFSIPLILLYIGKKTLTSTSAMGARSVIKLAQKGSGYVKTGVKLAATAGAGLATGGITGAGSIKGMATRGDMRLREKLSKQEPFGWGMSKEGTPIPGGIAAIKRRASRITTWGLRNVDKLEQKHFSTSAFQQQNQIDQIQKKLSAENLSREDRLIAFRSATKPTEKIGAYLALLQKKEHRDLSLEERTKIADQAYNIHYSLGKQIIKSDPKVAQTLYDNRQKELNNLRDERNTAMLAGNHERVFNIEQKIKASEDKLKKEELFMDKNDIEKYGNIYAKIIATASPENIAKMSRKEDMNDPNFMEAIMRGSGAQISALGKEFGSLFVEGFSKKAEEILDKDPTWFVKHNYKLYRYSTGNAGAEMGIPRLGPENEYQPKKEAKPTILGPENEYQPKKEAKPTILSTEDESLKKIKDKYREKYFPK